ncbi:MAG: class I SAM-dependent methyltransferase [Pseudodesulfovibrio sp.]|uniref:Methyltransferase type 11 n=1 Tax=Pseudodesulfovibrio aespoeensis (strain ATCC 700646 / DSM 10631 / Aspo-2) TaxID=643562 RepID=E6VR00_PSEA9|nr:MULTISPECIES: class I SAM-dependent methyltransferase [Pseudodesulfovibrio]MBU4191588.1 class I SAM-dependent methyltransferase [Pseudomonadota bacterium]ADU62980.1 Methyltransferase type 11 [Pseudodesulfovibrio aespoeensis Aspo-2]MBU4380239.1 class I SAM-dependent methyltransferase [Pseudomonadota bacterium]MBU4475916.1 class I SAM-dependent methyltransferase [Pseudomonadota bacterium]MBU4516754.1 class I SAM-dependent methyltransferase [Pseudomonadota bacterium]
MGTLRDFVTKLHTGTNRDYLARMVDDKVHCMLKAKEYEADYWDGDRRYGYGGYRYMPGRWKPVAQAMIDAYGLKPGARILDVGCGKAYLLYELAQLGMDVHGFDISRHGLADAKEEIRDTLFLHRAQDAYPFKDGEFDLVISITTLHNLELFDLKAALREIERVGINKYVCVESYRNELEQFNLQCWALTCESFFSQREWEWIFDQFGYTGDFEFIYFE